MVQIGAVVPVRFYCQAEGAGESVLFIHDLGLSRGEWDGVWRELEGCPFRRFRFDGRGHGNSTTTSSGYSFLDAAYDLMGVYRKEDIGSAHLVGSGTGAGAAVAFALRWPRCVRSLTLLSPIVGGWTWSEAWLIRLRQVAAGFRVSQEAGVQAWMRQPRFDSLREKPELWQTFCDLLAPWNGKALTGPADSPPPETPDAHRFAQLPVSPLVVAGQREDPEILSACKAMEAMCPGTVLEIWRGRGACLPLEQPELLAQMVRNRVAVAAMQGRNHPAPPYESGDERTEAEALMNERGRGAVSGMLPGRDG